MYWFTDVEATNNTVRNNVKVPNHWVEGDDATNDDVTEYTKNLNDNFIGNEVKVTVTPAVAGLTPKVTWLFSDTQPAINGTKWTVSTDKKTLSYNGVAVVTIDSETGEITYLCNDTSKALLNLWAHNETEIAKILYCNVDIIASYDDEKECHIDLGSETIHVRFLRPVNFSDKASGKLKDGIPTGDYIAIGTIFEATDWQGYKIFKQDADGKYVPCYYPDEDDPTGPVNWYGYYGFSKLKVDVDAIKTDQTGSVALLKTVNPAAKCWVSEIGDRMTEINPAEVDITDIDNLQGYVFNYFNNMGVVADFNLYVPITVSYAWGEYTATITVPVTRTY